MSVMPKSVGKASPQLALQLNEGEGELVVVAKNPTKRRRRRGSYLELEKDVIRNNDETVEEFVFRISELREKILQLAILDGPVGESSPSKELALSYRLVCRDWRDNINSIYRTAALPLLEFKHLYPVDLAETKRMVKNLKSLTPLFAPESDACSEPPASLGFDLSPTPSIRLKLTAAKIELEATVLSTLSQMGRMLLKLDLVLPHNPLEGMNCSSLHLPNLKHVEFTFDNPHYNYTPDTPGPWKVVEDIVKAASSLKTLTIRNEFPGVSAEMPELTLPKSLEKLELRLIRIPMWLVDIAPTLKNMRQLVLKLGVEVYEGYEERARQEPAGYLENLLINKLSKTLEFLELEERWPRSLLSELSEHPFTISEPMPKLRTLNFSVRFWKLRELRSYRELLPSLTDLDLFVYLDEVNFLPSWYAWYASPCSTLRRLRLQIYEGPSEASLLSQEVLGGISRSFPNLSELELVSDQCADSNWQAVLCQGFPNLCKLKIECWDVSAEQRNRLVAAVSGIPLEELQAIWQGEKELEQIINNYQHFPSLRNLTVLQDLELDAYKEGEDDEEDDDDEDRHVWKTDSSVMVYSTFLRMPNLKKVVLSSMFRLTDELKQHARNETGLDIS